MSERLEGKVAFISGAARGQGRAHAVRLARDGADIIGVDICSNIASMNYSNASIEDLDETVRLVEKQGRRMVALRADVRDFAGLSAAFEQGYAEFGRVDIIVANAGIIRIGSESDDFLVDWRDTIDVNLTGVFLTIRVALPAMRQGGRGGSIVLTSSTAGIKGTKSIEASSLAYSAAKRGLVGMMQNLANVLAAESIPRQHRSPDSGAERYVTEPGRGQDDGRLCRGFDHSYIGHAKRFADLTARSRRHRQRGRLPGVGRSQRGHRNPVPY